MSSELPLRLRLPATSANLGPGFDALGLAMDLFLEVKAFAGETFSISATGRNSDLVGSLRRNLMLDTYRALAPAGPPLRLIVHNEIPLGMGCGSSAAALLAGVHLANHFGELGWSPQQILEEACFREGHPDNVAACFYGGMTVSSMQGRKVTAATFGQALSWKLVLVLPAASLATSEARALLPESYTRADTVQNIQATALLVAAFAQDRPELLAEATRDRVHQPYRMKACPLLERLLPLSGVAPIYSVTLSGAGPSVLLIADSRAASSGLEAQIKALLGAEQVELVITSLGTRSGEMV